MIGKWSLGEGHSGGASTSHRSSRSAIVGEAYG